MPECLTKGRSNGQEELERVGGRYAVKAFRLTGKRTEWPVIGSNASKVKLPQITRLADSEEKLRAGHHGKRRAHASGDSPAILATKLMAW